MGIALTVIMLLTNTLTAYITITGTKNMYLESKNENLIDEVQTYINLFLYYETAPTFVASWAENQDLIRRPYTEDEQIIKDLVDQNLIQTSQYTLEYLDSSLYDQEGILKAFYDHSAEYFDLMYNSGKFDRFYCVVPNDDGSATIVLKCSAETVGKDHGIGTPLSKDSVEYSCLMGLPKTVNDDVDYGVLFDEMFDKKENVSLYAAYSPVYADGELCYVVFAEFDWTSFADVLRSNLVTMIVLGFVGMVIANAVLILYIYFSAVRPISRVNAGVREYMESKDSAATESKMKQIKSGNEIGALADSIAEMSVEIDNYTKENLRLNSERERVAAELSLATNIQASQLPSTFPAFPDRSEFELYASMTPAKEVGGDFYDFFLLDDDHLGLVIADVSGKGVPAAMFMMISKLMIKNFAMSGFSPSEVLEKTNESIFESNKEKMFVTVWLGILEISTGKITASNAGHEYPAVRQPDGSFELLKDKHGFMIGIKKNKKYTEYETELKKGATLFVYTDGVPEATNSDKKLFGTDRMLEALNKEPDASPEKLLENVRNAVNEFVGDAPQFDDLTMLAVTIK